MHGDISVKPIKEFSIDHERKKCARKTERGNVYDTEEDARIAVRALETKARYRINLSYWQCIVCGKFHTGKTPYSETGPNQGYIAPHRQPLRYYGSKWNIAPWLEEQYPAHYCFAVPYGGGTSEIFRKSPSRLEIYNDMDLAVVTFFRVLRDRPDELIRAISLTPFSRAELEDACETLRNLHSWFPWFARLFSSKIREYELEVARQFFVKSRIGRSGNTSAWNSSFKGEYKPTRDKHSIEEWNEEDYLWAAAARLKKVQIERMPALHFIKKYDAPNTLFYLDPPYVHSTRYTNWTSAYEHEMTDEDHEKLAEVLYGIEGMAIISGYDGPLYKRLFEDQGWLKRSTAARDVQNQKKTETIWINPAAANRQRQLSMF